MEKTLLVCPYCRVDNDYSLVQIKMGVCQNCWKTLPTQLLDDGRKIIEVLNELDGDRRLSLVVSTVSTPHSRVPLAALNFFYPTPCAMAFTLV